MIDTQSVWYLLGILIQIPLAILRSNIVFDYLDQAYFNIIATSILHLTFVGFTSYLHILAIIAYTLYLKGKVNTLTFVALLYTHLTYINWSYNDITTASHMMVVIRAHYYFVDKNPPAHDSPYEDALSYLLNPVGYFTGPNIPYSTYTELPINDAENLHIDHKAIVNIIRYATTYVLGQQVINQVKQMSYLISVPVRLYVIRNKYYTVWELNKLIAQLYGYPEALAVNVHPEKVESSTTITEVIRNWNVSTQAYLKNTVYKSLRASELTVHQAKVMTFVISGLWHGLTWRYLFSSTGIGIFVAFASNPFKDYHHKNKTVSQLYKVFQSTLSYLYLHVMMGVIMIPFMDQTHPLSS